MFSKIKESVRASYRHIEKRQPLISVSFLKGGFGQYHPTEWGSDEILIQKKRIETSILLFVFTFGLYGILWQYHLIKNTRAIKNDTASCTGEMLCYYFVPFYFIYWWITRSDYVKKSFAEKGYSAISDKFFFMLLCFPILNLIPLALMQNDFNSLPSKTPESAPKHVTLFTVRCSLTSLVLGFVFFVASLLFVLLDIRAFSSVDFSEKWLLFWIAFLIPFVMAVTTIFRFETPDKKLKKVLPFLMLFLMPILTITMTECLNNIFIYDMTYLGFFANYMLVLNLYFLVFALSGSFRVSYLVINPILYILALAHSYIMDFRGTPFLPMDLLGTETAMGVAGTYNYTPTYKVVIGTLLFLYIMIVAAKTRTPQYRFPTKLISRISTGVLSCALFIVYFLTNLLVGLGVKPDFWNQTRGYQNYGFAFNFFANTRYLWVSKPKNYDSKDVSTLVKKQIDESPERYVVNTDKPRPNIICIMNESLADMGILGNLETNEDYMPFMRNLKKNTIKGNLYVPVIGAGTSNTEFEFLTGHSTAFLPSGSNAYMLYIKNPLASLVSTLRSQGYSTYALHPYYAAGWHRTDVYSYMGFDKFTSLEDIIDIKYMEEFQKNGSDPNYLQKLIEENYPDEKNMLIRQYISDSYNYKLLIQDFENRDKSVPYFAFNVTMQNHGGYINSCVNFDQNIYPTNVQGDYVKAKNYLSLVQKSDTAFKELIGYFSKVKEPTLICMFGDHQPSVETQFIAEVMGVKSLAWLSMEQEQKRHVTPFYIWANYDIKEQQIDMLSSNYLSSLLLKTAGVEMTDYNKYLLELSKQLPVIDTVGYIDSEGNYYKWSDASDHSETLADYNCIQFNNIFDRDNVAANIFYLGGKIPEDEDVPQEEADAPAKEDS